MSDRVACRGQALGPATGERRIQRHQRGRLARARQREAVIGLELDAFCQRTARDLEDAESAVNQLQAGPRGWLRLTAQVSMGLHALAPLLGESGCGIRACAWTWCPATTAST